METLTIAIDEKLYVQLLARLTPRVIRTESEHERALAMVESLLQKGAHQLSAEESELLDLLTNLIQHYEASQYPPREKSAPHEMVAFRLEQRGLSPKDLWPALGSKSRVSEMLSGKRAPSKEQAGKLAAFFGVGVELFLKRTNSQRTRKRGFQSSHACGFSRLYSHYLDTVRPYRTY